MKKTLIIALFALMSMSAMAQEKIQWMSFEDAVERCAKEPKMVFIDVYTDWCGWCKRMDQSTFANPVIAKYMNEHFYAVNSMPSVRTPSFSKESSLSGSCDPMAAKARINWLMPY